MTSIYSKFLIVKSHSKKVKIQSLEKKVKIFHLGGIISHIGTFRRTVTSKIIKFKLRIYIVFITSNFDRLLTLSY